MNAFSDWFDNNWVDLARLFVQCGILAAVIVYSRSILKTLRASQEQIGALLRLSVSEGAAPDRRSGIDEPAPAPPGFSAPATPDLPRKAPLSEAAPTYAFSLHAAASPVAEREHSLGGHVALERPVVKEAEAAHAELETLTPWVAAPSTQQMQPEAGLAARMADSRRNLGRWLKEEQPRRSGGGFNPIRRMIRWLQAPAGTH